MINVTVIESILNCIWMLAISEQYFLSDETIWSVILPYK